MNGDFGVNEWEVDHRLFIAVAEACWRKNEPSYSWHVLDWMLQKLRRKYPLSRLCDRLISIDMSN
jgi:hypothetical protein